MCTFSSISRHVCLTVPTMRTSKFGCSVLALLGLVLRVHNASGDGELLFLEERDERTSARCTSGAVRELALLDGVHLRGAAGSSGVELVLRVHNAVSGCRRWTAGFSFSATNTEVARAPA